MENLNWTITAEERKKRTRKLVFRVWAPFIVLGVIAATIGYPASFAHDIAARGWFLTLQQAFYAMAGMAAGMLAMLLVNEIFPYSERTYLLDCKGLSVSSGKKKKNYPWDDFKCFYPYSERYFSKASRNSGQSGAQSFAGENRRGEIFNAEQEIAGAVFYLEKKPGNSFSRLFKFFVVVYSEPDNTKAVNKFLSEHLQRKTMKAASDLGLVSCEFK